uniref:Uncharacterized protein n=1 Tax=Nelumbo nucifera TaxID=4432 RepID=A0A822Y8U5_NELNU|nr:TPA_asm: hypothetical protein HUJ06_027486 [Nelumbo nucifera]
MKFLSPFKLATALCFVSIRGHNYLVLSLLTIQHNINSTLIHHMLSFMALKYLLCTAFALTKEIGFIFGNGKGKCL